MLGIGLGLTGESSLRRASGIDADAEALFAAWVAAGVPASDADKTKATTLITALKSAGVWSSLTVLQVYPVHAQAAALVNWKSPGTHNATLSGVPTFTAYMGFATDGVDDFVNVFNPFGVLAQDNFQVGVWLTDTAQSSLYHYGWYDGSDGILFNARTTSNQIGVFASVAAADVGLVTGITTAAGLTAINRSGANAVQAYRNGVAQTMTNASAASVAINNHALQIGCTSAFMVSNSQFAVAGASLTAPQHASLYTALNAYRPWTPLDLGASLAAWWSANDHGSSLMTDDGAGLISSWKDKVTGLAVTGTTTQRPTWAATSYNSAYAGLTFATTTNLSTATLTSVPTGAIAGELWISASNASVGATGNTVPISYGTVDGNNHRSILRASSSNLVLLYDGATVTSGNVAWAAPAIIGGAWAGTAQTGRQNGTAFPTPGVITTIATGTGKLCLGARAVTAPDSQFSGVIRHALITLTLTALQQQQLEGWLAWDAAFTSVLPGGHPYKLVRP